MEQGTPLTSKDLTDGLVRFEDKIVRYLEKKIPEAVKAEMAQTETRLESLESSKPNTDDEHMGEYTKQIMIATQNRIFDDIDTAVESKGPEFTQARDLVLMAYKEHLGIETEEIPGNTALMLGNLKIVA